MKNYLNVLMVVSVSAMLSGCAIPGETNVPSETTIETSTETDEELETAKYTEIQKRYNGTWNCTTGEEGNEILITLLVYEGGTGTLITTNSDLEQTQYSFKWEDNGHDIFNIEYSCNGIQPYVYNGFKFNSKDNTLIALHNEEMIFTKE